VLVRSGQTEGSVDLARLTGGTPAAVICEIMRDDGTMARLPELCDFAREHNILITSVADLIQYRLMHETLVEEVARAQLPSRYGDFQVRVFYSKVDQRDHVVFQLGEIDPSSSTLVRVHRANLVWDTFGRFRAEKDALLNQCLKAIQKEGRGVLLYLEHEDLRWKGMGDRGDGGQGMPFRAYGIGAQILRSLGLEKIRVLTKRSAPRAFVGLKAFGLDIEAFEIL
jgi:3,4-dihydroxy 2-butanone 4-phosphate synthase/GTP cyclohydrolase II